MVILVKLESRKSLKEFLPHCARRSRIEERSAIATCLGSKPFGNYPLAAL